LQGAKVHKGLQRQKKKKNENEKENKKKKKQKGYSCTHIFTRKTNRSKGSLTYHDGDVQTLSSGTRLRVVRRKCTDVSEDLASSIIMLQKAY
jgi:hypothetical protein